ncbi:XRE family transcriptional regulator [Catellatospora sp. NPDC049609]|uniref:XRE family transcriptional regulator n=1 Tax=Catellatospora sp. NPDC049609 TaxID=3155505 RepID=UPI00343D64B7
MDEGVVDRVRSVIIRVSPSQAAFSELVGISADKLSKSLNAVRRFTSLELALIADAGDVSVDWLLTGRTRAPAPPAAAPGAGDDLRALVDRFAAAYETLRLLGRRPRLAALPALPPGPPAPAGRELAERAVTAVRAATGRPGLHGLATADLAAAIEQAYAVDVALLPLPGGADALSRQTGHSRLILAAVTSRFTRQRFALTHALGHVLAGDADEPLLDQELAPGAQRADGEVRADAFAAAFLMPYDEVVAVTGRREVTDACFAELVRGFGVSAGAMAARLRALGLVDAPRHGELSRWTAARCHQGPSGRDALLAAMTAARTRRSPARLVGELFGAYADGATTLVPLAGLLDCPVDDLFAALVAEQPTVRRGYADEPAFQP